MAFGPKFQKLWTGRYPLRVSFLMVGAGALILLKASAIGIGMIERVLSPYIDVYILSMAGLSLFHVTAVLMLVIWGVGSARSFFNICPKSTSKYIIFIFACISIFAVVSFSIISAASKYKDLLSAMEGDPEWGSTSIWFSASDSRIYIRGPITRAAAYDFQQVVSKNATALSVGLESVGGRGDAAFILRKEIISRKLDTYVDGKCASACTILFLSGRKRIAFKTARLGFHSAFLGDSDAPFALREWLADEAASGVSGDFLRRAYSISHEDVWYPSLPELKKAGVVTDVFYN